MWLFVPRTSGSSAFSLSAKKNEAVHSGPPSKCVWESVCAYYAIDICALLMCMQDLLCLCAHHCNMCMQGECTCVQASGV